MKASLWLFVPLFQLIIEALSASYYVAFDHRRLSDTSNGMRTDIQTFITDASGISTYYFTFLIQSSASISITSVQCSFATVLTPQTFSGNLLIMTTYKNDPTDSALARSSLCTRDATTNEARIGIITFNIAQIYSVTDTYDFKQLVKAINREIITIFGFLKNSFYEWIDPFTSLKYGTNGPNRVSYLQTNRGFVDTLYLNSTFIQQTTKDYYSCSTLTGLQLENQEDYSSSSSVLHFERSILYNECMTATLLDGDSVFSVFTGALLKDMNYFTSINFNYLDSITFGSKKGCNFVSQLCSAANASPEFNTVATQTLKCDFYGQGIGEDIADTYVDPGCKIPKIKKTNLCNQSTAADTTTRQIYGESSRCFNSEARPSGTSAAATDPFMRCHQTICASDKLSLQIQLLGTQTTIATCGANKEGSTVNLFDYTSGFTDKTVGSLTCPSDYTSFCTVPSRCHLNCSMKGFCNNGYCVCLSGYSGEGCENPCVASAPYWNGTNCVATCPTSLFANPDNMCKITCPDGYYKHLATQVCKKCHLSCKTCTDSLQSTCLTCNYPYTLASDLKTCEIKCYSICTSCFGTASNQCTSCSNGYYLYIGTCLPCVSPCQNCSSVITCTSCIANYQLVVSTSICNPICHSSCATCSGPTSPFLCLTCPLTTQFLSPTNSCVSCSSNCATCQGTADFCLTCYANYYLYEGVCFPICTTNCQTCFSPATNACTICHSGYYLNASSCTACPTDCKTCNTSGVCLMCISGRVWNGSNCVANPTCTFNNCLTCSSVDKRVCLTCSLGYFLKNGECQPCNSNCYECDNEAQKCTSCNTLSTLNTGTQMCELNCHSSCNTCSTAYSSTSCLTCYSGYMINPVTKTCSKCVSPCDECATTTSTCSSCVANYIYKGSGVCDPSCHATCRTCSAASDATKCTSCFTGSFLDANNACTLCQSPCQTCSGLATSCDGCVTNYTLVGSLCTPNCDSSCNTCDQPMLATACQSCKPGAYLTNSKTCLACSTAAFCNTCVFSATYCTSCLANYTLSAGTCTPICPTYCKTCTVPYSQASCTACVDGYYPVMAGTTITACLPCTSPCKTCSLNAFSVIDCDTCIDLIDYSYDTALKRCNFICDSSCATCSLPNNANACLTCSPAYFKLNVSSTSCTACSSGCQVCSGHAENCTTCLATHTMVNNQCYLVCSGTCRTCAGAPTTCTSCNNGYFLNGTSCDLCVAPCAYCTSSTACSTCIANYTYVPATNSCSPVCDPSCQSCSAPISSTSCTSCFPGTYLTPSNTCSTCTTPCQTCMTTSTNCTSCIAAYVPFGSTCIPDCGLNCLTCTTPGNINTCTQCVPNYYLVSSTNPVTLAVTKSCPICSTNCKTCSGSSAVCTSCYTNYSLVGNTCQPTCDSSCKTCSLPVSATSCSSCYPGTYLTTSNTCLTCTSPCNECNMNTSNCTSCITNYYVYPLPLASQTATLKDTCLPQCDPTCATCSVPLTYNKCYSCVDGYYLVYINASSASCSVCPTNCATCSGSTTCLTCKTGYRLDVASCIPNNCHSTCQTCSLPYNQNACSSCYSDHWFNPLTLTCSPCLSPCRSCTSNTACTSCLSNYTYSGSTCSPVCASTCTTCSAPLLANACLTCPTLYTLQSDNTCVACDPKCTVCTGSPTICSACATGYKLVPIASTSNQSTCTLDCSLGCATCSGTASNCLSCLNGYVYNSVSATCSMVCDSSCLTCSNSNDSGACLTCKSGYTLKSGKCTACVAGTYSTGSSTCEKCMTDCVGCTSASLCDNCRAGYYFNGTKCELRLPETFIIRSDCNYSCATCIDSYASCLTCAENRTPVSTPHPVIVECPCPSGTTDTGVSRCDDSGTQTGLMKATIAFYATSMTFAAILGAVTLNPIGLFGLLDHTQTLSSLTYVDQQSTAGFDKTMDDLYVSHITGLINLSSMAPSVDSPFRKRILYDSQSSMYSEVDSGVLVSDYQRKGSERMFLNDKTEYFLVNALILLIVHLIAWVCSAVFQNYGLIPQAPGTTTTAAPTVVQKDMKQPEWKHLMRRIFSISFVIMVFFFTFSELSMLAFLQFYFFGINSTLQAFSSLFAVAILIYLLGFAGYMYHTIQVKGLFKPPVTATEQIQAKLVKPNQIAPVEQIKPVAYSPLQEKFSVFGEYLNHTTMPQRVFVTTLFIRKLLVSILQVFVYTAPIAQILLMTLFYLAGIIYIVIVRPFKNVTHMIFYLALDSIVMLIHILLFVRVCFTDFNQSSQFTLSRIILILTLIVLITYTLICLIPFIQFVIRKVQNKVNGPEQQYEQNDKDQSSSISNLYGLEQSEGQTFLKSNPVALNQSVVNPVYDSMYVDGTTEEYKNRTQSAQNQSLNQKRKTLQPLTFERSVLFDNNSNLFHFIAARDSYI